MPPSEEFLKKMGLVSCAASLAKNMFLDTRTKCCYRKTPNHKGENYCYYGIEARKGYEITSCEVRRCPLICWP